MPSTYSGIAFDPYLGNKDICLHVESTVKKLFPSVTSKQGRRSSWNPSAAGSSDHNGGANKALPDIGEWLAYMIYRTNLSKGIIFHALHLLRRIARLPQGSLTSPLFSTTRPLGHYSLIVASFILATTYQMDDSYTLKSWCIASKGLHTLKEITELELDMLDKLGWRLRAEGENLGSILVEDEAEWKEEKRLSKKEARESEEKVRLALVSEKTEAEQSPRWQVTKVLKRRLSSLIHHHQSGSPSFLERPKSSSGLERTMSDRHSRVLDFSARDSIRNFSRTVTAH